MKSDAETSRQMPRDSRAEGQDRRHDRGRDRRDNQDRRQDNRQDRRPPRPEKPTFNNPFAEQLAKFKK
jgi:hypothetical protein